MHFRFSCCAIQSVFEQVLLLLLHLALNSKHSIDYTIQSVNHSIQFVLPSFVRNETRMQQQWRRRRQRAEKRASTKKKKSSFINPSIQLSDKRQICALMLSFKRSTTQLLVWIPTSLRRQCEHTFTVTPRRQWHPMRYLIADDFVYIWSLRGTNETERRDRERKQRQVNELVWIDFRLNLYVNF